MTCGNMHHCAIIGFGSLLWDLDTLQPHVSGLWEYYTGPTLPLEFSLVSQKRNRALALAIDLEHGAPCPTSIIKSRRDSIPQAIMDLAVREHTKVDNIGFSERETGNGWSHSKSILNMVRDWLESSAWDAAIWTDSASNFLPEIGIEFSVGAAYEYLRSLSESSILEAKRYIENAPDRVDTPLRRTLIRDLWWRSLS